MFRVYAKPDCPHCKNAQAFIMKNFPNEEIDYIDITQTSVAKDFLLAQGFKTVPQIYHVYGETEIHIGGYDKLPAYTKEWYMQQLADETQRLGLM